MSTSRNNQVNGSAVNDHTSRDDGEDAPPSADDEDFYDRLYQAERNRPRRLAHLPRLVLEAVSLVWHTSRWGTVGIASVQVLSALIAAVQVFLGGLAVRQLVNFTPGHSVGQIIVPILLLALAILVSTLGVGGGAQMGRLLGLRVEREVAGRVLDVASRVSLVKYEDADFYDRLSRVMANVLTRPFGVVTCLASLVGGLAGVVTLTATIIYLQPVVLAVVAVCFPALWYVTRRSGRLEFDFAVEQTQAIRERQYLNEILSDRRPAAELRAYSTGRILRSRYDALYDDFIGAMRYQIRQRYALGSISALATGAVMVVNLVVIAVLVDHGTMSVARGAATAVAIRLLGSRLQQLFAGLSQLFESALFLDDYDQFVNGPDNEVEVHTTFECETAEVPPSARLSPSEPFRAVQVDSVSFAYPGTSTNALSDIDLYIEAGEVVALVGENGSGKTTLAKVIAGLYMPSDGEVVWNGRAVAPDSLGALRDQVALVLQDFTQYAFTASENIWFGRPDAPVDEGRVHTAASRVGADRFIEKLPDSYDTRLSRLFDGGRELSVGQWQRIALARAFYRDAPLVILDEPTAALDARGEHQLYENMRRVLAGRTVILITHRMNSVRDADRIVVMKEGRVIEQGTHSALIDGDGLYAELVRLQNHGGIAGAAGRRDSEDTIDL